ncbi:hypothetical protein [Spirosoma sp. 209]|uniref:hypothetical protein n=1 Tax=Spirosoma sp. 209 TaxID=1955701 RepID=UPI00098D5AFE|nr:hypothetical protein [Spirosoma sp. 209]
MDQRSADQTDLLSRYPLRIHSLAEQHELALSSEESTNLIVANYEDVSSLLRAWRKHETEPGIIIFKGPATDETSPG